MSARTGGSTGGELVTRRTIARIDSRAFGTSFVSRIADALMGARTGGFTDTVLSTRIAVTRVDRYTASGVTRRVGITRIAVAHKFGGSGALT